MRSVVLGNVLYCCLDKTLEYIVDKKLPPEMQNTAAGVAGGSSVYV